MIHIQSDWSQVDAEIDRVLGMPGPKAKALLDAVLEMGFAVTQEAVHIETGSLKASGQHKSDVDPFDKKWVGTIEYGGVTLGPNNPVDYAIYEKARGTHWAGPSSIKGDHDFFAGLPALHPAYVAAMKAGLKG